MRWATMALLMGALVMTACDKELKHADFTNAAALTKSTKFLVGEITSDVEIPAEVDYKARWPKELKERLVQRKILAAPDDPTAVTIDARVTAYERGSAFARWGTFGEAGQTKLTLVATLVKAGEAVGTVEAHRTIKGGGLYSAGAWGFVFENVAEIIVEEAEKKMGTVD